MEVHCQAPMAAWQRQSSSVVPECEWQAGSLSHNSFYLGHYFLYTLGIVWNDTAEPKRKLHESLRGTMNLELKSSRPPCYSFVV